MNPFEGSGQPQIPLPPLDIPVPDVPKANFASIGGDLAKGAKDSGFWDGLWQSLITFIAQFVGTSIGALMGLLGWIATYIARIFLVARQQNEDTLAEASAAAVSDLFGVPIDSSQFKQLANSGQRKPMAKNAAEGLLNALGGSFQAGSPGQLAPSSERAEEFVTTIMNLCVEGWLEGWMMEALSAGQLETFAELKDIVAHALGLGRLTRAVLSPAINVLVHDPFLWKLNQSYRPKLLSEGTAVRQFVRGRMTREQLDTELGYQGYSADRIEALINQGQLHVPTADLVTLIAHNELDSSLAVQMLKDQGYTDTQAQMVLRIQHLTRGDALTMDLAKMAIDAWAVGTLTESDVSQFINQDGITEQEKAYLGLLKDLKSRIKRKQFGLSQATTMVEVGIWDLDRFRAWALLEGYTDDDERDLELLTFGKIKDKSDAKAAKAAHAKEVAASKAAKVISDQAKAAAAVAALPAHGVAIAKYETLVLDGIRTIDQYRAFLHAKGLTPDNQDAFVTLLNTKLQKASTTSAGKAANSATAAEKNLNLAQLDKAVRAGVLSIDEYKARLEQIGFPDTDVQILVDVASNDLATAATKTTTKAGAVATGTAKGISIAQEERAVRLGLKTISDYQAFLSAHGYADEDATLLSAELQKQLDADQAALKTRAGAVVAAQAKGLSLTQLEQAVRAGVNTIDQYQAALASLGYSSDAQASLVSLLELQMQTDQQNLAAQGTAAGLLGARGVSLSDLQRAVKLGVVPVSVYSDALTRAGVSADDSQLLTLTLTAQVSASKKAAKPTPQVNAALKAAGLSAATLHNDVLSGKLTLDQYQATLLGASVDPASVAALVGVVTDELANQQAVGDKLALAEKAATAKGLSLSQFTQAVLAGVKTLDDYATFVSSLGFDDADVDTLAATLAAKLSKQPQPKPTAGG